MRYAATVANNINCLLDGASDPDPEEFGHTTEEERSLSGCVQVQGLELVLNELGVSSGRI